VVGHHALFRRVARKFPNGAVVFPRRMARRGFIVKRAWQYIHMDEWHVAVVAKVRACAIARIL